MNIMYPKGTIVIQDNKYGNGFDIYETLHPDNPPFHLNSILVYGPIDSAPSDKHYIVCNVFPQGAILEHLDVKHDRLEALNSAYKIALENHKGSAIIDKTFRGAKPLNEVLAREKESPLAAKTT